MLVLPRKKIASLCWTITDAVLPKRSKRRIAFKQAVSIGFGMAKQGYSKIHDSMSLLSRRSGVYRVADQIRLRVRVALRTLNPVHVINPTGLFEERVVLSQDSVSIVIPTKDAGDQLSPLLSVLKNQRGLASVDLVIVDSGSTDDTVKIAEEFGATIVQIPPEDFSHSYARNLGAEQAKGDYLLFTVQDALPPSDSWLRELLAVMKHNNLVAVSCAEFPKEDADLFYRVMAWNHYKFLELEERDRIGSKPVDGDPMTLRKNGHLSNLACLISKPIFLNYKFKGDFAEDLDLGIRLLKDGHRLALLGSVRVIHSHNRPAFYHLRRGYVDKLWLSKIVPGRNDSVLDSDKLLCDVVFAYRSIKPLMRNTLQGLDLPCRPADFSRALIQNFNAFLEGKVVVPSSPERDVPADHEFKLFITTLIDEFNLRAGIDLPYEGKLLYGIRGFMELTCGYLGQTYDWLDDHIMDDLVHSLYKCLAFQAGHHLASCFLQANESDRTKLWQIHHQLQRGI